MRAGDIAPDFELPDQDGVPRRLSEFVQDGPVALFWYPGALTSGCTREACHFRDLAAQFRAAGVQRVGISRDPVAKQQRFASTHAFDYPLLSDGDGRVAEQFGVTGGWLRQRLGAPVKRVTFVIGRDRRITEVIASETSMDAHAERALRAVTAGS